MSPIERTNYPVEQITPDYPMEKYGIEADDFINEVGNILHQIDDQIETKPNRFPFRAFPNMIQNIIINTNETLNFPIDFIGVSMLFASSVAIGNTRKVQIYEQYVQNGVLYIAILGAPGSNKSHPLTYALNPIEERDKQNFEQFQREKKEYDYFMKLNNKDDQASAITKPVLHQNLISDFTPEALSQIQILNLRGMGVYTDELGSWFRNFNRYMKGSDEQFWLSNWSGKPVRVNRKTSDPIMVKHPFVSVCGTIQPGVLHELANNRTENGFLDRILFAFPENSEMEYWNEKQLNPKITQDWAVIINYLLNIEANHEDGKILQFSPTAKERMFAWQREIADMCNRCLNEEIRGIYPKFEQYTLRLALILQMLRYACNEGNDQEISIEAVNGAIDLVKYFINTAFKVRKIISRQRPLDKFPQDKINLFHALPVKFTTEEGLRIAERNGMAERTFKRFIDENELFQRISRGIYEKKF